MWRHKVKGIVQMWLSGEAGGSAIANVLFGKYNPSGKISETFPNKTRTDIDYPGDGYKVCYDEKWRVGYRYYDKHTDEIWFPFGHGLSYTSFEYSDMKIKESDDGFKIYATIKNVGDFEGAEIVQLYFSDTVSTVSRPEKELCGFEKIFLKPGEAKTIVFDVSLKDISYYNVILKKWVAETGKYIFKVGASSQDIRLLKEIMLNKPVEYTLQYNAEQIMG